MKNRGAVEEEKKVVGIRAEDINKNSKLRIPWTPLKCNAEGLFLSTGGLLIQGLTVEARKILVGKG